MHCSLAPTQAAACAIGLAQRKSNDFLDAARIKELELVAGKAVLRTLATAALADDQAGGCSDPALRVW